MQMVTKLPAQQAQNALAQLEAAWSYYMPQPVLLKRADKATLELKEQADPYYHTAA